MNASKYVKVTATIWMDVAAMKRNEADIGFDMSEDPVWDAEAAVRQTVDSITAGVAFKMRSVATVRVPKEAESMV